MGEVYLAEDETLGRTVAVKVIASPRLMEPEARNRFLREARTMARVEHPNVVPIHAFGESEGRLYFVMQYIEGETLARRLQNTGLLPVDRALDIVRQVVEALRAVWDCGIVHRDIKPSNILIDAEGRVRVADFGLAKPMMGHGEEASTQTGCVLGTPYYIAPEQVRGGPIDFRADMYAVGILLYEMLVGEPPFSGVTPVAVLEKQLYESLPRVRDRRPDVPSGVQQLIEVLTRKDPRQRLRSYEELLIALDALRGRSALTMLPLSFSLLRWRGRRRYLTLALLLFMGIGLAAWWWLRPPPGPVPVISVAVADFQNQTGEPELDGLSGMLITALEQSDRLSVMTRSRMLDILKQMGRGSVDRIDEPLGSELALRAQIDALVIASIRKFGRRYTIDLKVLDPVQGAYRMTTRVDGEGQERIPAMIDRVARRVRSGLKDRVVFGPPAVARMTTANLEAYQSYFLGEQWVNKLDFDRALQAFDRAVELDPEFALAHYRRAYVLRWRGRVGFRSEMRRAMQYIDRVPERERMMMRAFAAHAAKRFSEALDLYRKVVVRYPQEKEALWMLGDISYHQGDPAGAEKHLQRVLALDPSFERANHHLLWLLRDQGRKREMLAKARQYLQVTHSFEAYELLWRAQLWNRDFDAARATAREARDRFPERPSSIAMRAWSAFAEGDWKTAQERLASLVTSRQGPKTRWVGLIQENSLYAYQGKYRAIFENLARARQLAQRLRDDNWMAIAIVYEAFWVMKGYRDVQRARELVEASEAYQKFAERIYFMTLMKVYLMMGDFDRAAPLVRDHIDTFAYTEVAVRAHRDWAEGRRMQAIQGLEMVVRGAGRFDGFYYLYDLARFEFQLGRLQRARLFLEEFLETDYGFHDMRAPSEPQVRVLLAQVYARLGQRQRALATYREFLNRWSEADSDLPLLQEAKAAYAQLQRQMSR